MDHFRTRFVAMLFTSLALLGALVMPVASSAQEATPTATSGDSFVGAWQFTTFGTPSLGTFTADGNFIVSSLPVEPVFEGADFEMLLLRRGHGVWEATGDTTADFTFAYL